MPKKTLALITGLVLVTVILFIIAVRTGQQTKPVPKEDTTVAPTASQAHSVLSMSPNPVEVGSGQTGSVSVEIDPSDNPVTAVQLELTYDPTMVSNVKVTPGPLFTNAVVLINKNNTTTGRITYAFGIQPNQKTINTIGSVATVSFTARGAVGKQSELTLMPSSLVTARGVASSVLKSGTGTMITIGNGKAAAGTPGTTTTEVVTPQTTTAPIDK